MFLKLIEITPTSVLTFRKVPMSHKKIDTYNFIPPTTLSGYLYRLLKLAQKEELPVPRRFKTTTPNIDEYYILETKYSGVLSLGAYSSNSKSFTSFRMGYQHVGKGHSIADGLDIFDPTENEVISLIQQKINNGCLESIGIETFINEYKKSNLNKYYKRGVYKAVLLGHDVPKWSTFKKEERRQPLDWSYNVTEKYYGLLISKNAPTLDKFDILINYGFKIGKEGFAFISKIFKTAELKLQKGVFISSTLVPASLESLKILKGNGLESIYYFRRDSQSFVKNVFFLNGTEAEGEYLTSTVEDININIPAKFVDILGWI
ncbi:hypothetical protein Mtc_1191 [Methanocella conradii HZ254]|uniref:Uncharacterized protein n=1 Tax=Methanocella conradii (strain DSM 24694 / JCM 17849 / CGMCC 1.5162 / HZ254) TaxID=1041930 RepID=H8I8P0_METCZ|nr:hypothetical protein [Methanocella conradii]AFC99944.1 hypothetical protein Mtc_1191 [Methanocella conradii HZ254]